MFSKISGAARAVSMAFVALGLSACQPYQPPAGPASTQNQAVVAASYDQVWNGLVDYVSQSSFSIETFEKDSGLMVLSFLPDDRERYIDCGLWQQNAFVTVPYVARKSRRFRLNGSKMNIRVREISPGQTSVQVTALYKLRDKSKNYWEFTSSRPSTITVTSGNQRTCRSKNVVEGQIIRDIEAMTFR